jgi:hypothetical protein
MKKPFQMTVKELGDAHEQRTAKALNGRVQVGSGSVRVPRLRGDVIAAPLMIECKSTAKSSITIKYDVWADLLRKVKETRFLPAYALSVVDQFGNFYDFVGINKLYFTDEILAKMTRGFYNHVEVKKTKNVSFLIEMHKANKYLSVTFVESGHTLLFVPLPSFARYFPELVKGL